MKILFLTRDYKNRSDAYTLYFPLWKALREQGIEVYERDTSKYGLNYEPKVLNGEKFEFDKLDYNMVNKFDWVIIENFFPYWFEDWDKIKCKKALILEDLHGYCPNYVDKINKKTNIDVYLTHYLYPFIENYLQRPYFWFPHCSSHDIFFPRNKTIDVLFTGTNGGCYKLRDKIISALKNKPYFTRIERPLNREMKYPYGNDYGNLLGSSKISFATSSSYKYMIAKYFEIIASGTLLIANTIKEMSIAGFMPNVHYVELDWDCNEEDIVNIVEYYLNNSDERKRIINNALKLSENHTPKIRVKQMINNIKNLK